MGQIEKSRFLHYLFSDEKKNSTRDFFRDFQIQILIPGIFGISHSGFFRGFNIAIPIPGISGLSGFFTQDFFGIFKLRSRSLGFPNFRVFLIKLTLKNPDPEANSDNVVKSNCPVVPYCNRKSKNRHFSSMAIAQQKFSHEIIFRSFRLKRIPMRLDARNPYRAFDGDFSGPAFTASKPAQNLYKMFW